MPYLTSILSAICSRPAVYGRALVQACKIFSLGLEQAEATARSEARKGTNLRVLLSQELSNAGLSGVGGVVANAVNLRNSRIRICFVPRFILSKRRVVLRMTYSGKPGTADRGKTTVGGAGEVASEGHGEVYYGEERGSSLGREWVLGVGWGIRGGAERFLLICARVGFGGEGWALGRTATRCHPASPHSGA